MKKRLVLKKWIKILISIILVLVMFLLYFNNISDHAIMKEIYWFCYVPLVYIILIYFWEEK